MTFTHLGEQWLDQWLKENARVSWISHPRPWELEKELLGRISAPLNLQDNRRHPFFTELSEARRYAKKEARNSPIAHEGNQTRSLQT